MSAPGTCGTCGGRTSARRHSTCRRCILAAAKGPGRCGGCGGPCDARYASCIRCRTVDLDEFMWLVDGGEWVPRAASRVGVSVEGVEKAARRADPIRRDVLDAIAREALAS